MQKFTFCAICAFVFSLILAKRAKRQQFPSDQSTIDLFGNRDPQFNMLPSNPNYLDPERLEEIERYRDHREEEGREVVFLSFEEMRWKGVVLQIGGICTHTVRWLVTLTC